MFTAAVILFSFRRSPILLRFPRLPIISTRDVFGKNNHGRPGPMEMILKSPNRTARPRVPHDREQQRCPMSGCVKLTAAHEPAGDVCRLQFGPFGRRMGGEIAGNGDEDMPALVGVAPLA